ncbi:protein ELYS-like isoform X2 [Asterias rubens]|uniref:protein ELYS-like isoform X2 n=1 Tax=Asterias rubens TaxID=7604 RepID=UPI0014554574|nr:protein ELYS-like isoform X2 [Asterias rubens]
MAQPMEAHWTSDVQPLCSTSLLALQGSTASGGSSLFGGCVIGGKWSWLARHSILEVVDNSTGNRCSAFQFGRAVGESNTLITCVQQYSLKGATYLIVGLKTGSTKGALCIFDPHTSKVILAVSIPQGVTAVEPITSTGGLDAPSFALDDHLRLFFGIIAVGTEGGHTYLVDVRLDDSESCDEVTIRGSKVISPRSTDVGSIRVKAARKGEHLCLELDEDSHSYRSFSFRKPDDSVIKSFYPSDVSVTSLAYIKQTGTLAVGFSFGCFQLWELAGPALVYSSLMSKQSSPVTHFTYQEPEDDPQYFCYLWVGRGPQATDIDQDVPTNLHMFQLMYDQKENYENYGHLYKELISCEARFIHELTLDSFNVPNHSSVGSRIISCFTLEKEPTPNAIKQEESMCDEEGDRLDLALAAFVWEARSDPADGQVASTCFLALFDLNRWYYAQMPRVIRRLPNLQGSPFFAFLSLDSILQAASPDFLMDVHINPQSFVPYISSQIPAPEKHFQPTSLSFDVTCLMEAGLVTAKFLGQQKQVLADLCQQGPAGLRDPQFFFSRCYAVALLPRRNAPDLGPGNTNAQSQREALLSVAVEHNLVNFVILCIVSWTQGDFPSGCNLRTVLDWAWGMVTSIKQSIDQICVPFYNGEGTHVDDQTRRTLDQHVVRLGHMITIIQSLLDQSGTTTEQGLKDLETKCNVVMLIHQHLKAVVWFVRNGLLPECQGEDDVLEGQFCYPAVSLRKVYSRRRSQLQKMCRNSGDGDILMIDGLVSEIGSQLSSLWDRKEEGGTGLYPPPSFHALLDMYLVDTVPVVTKHCIVGYFLLDVLYVSKLSGTQKEELGRKIDKFCQSFSLPLGVTKLLHGFSLLDRKEYDAAIDMLLDPTTTLDLAPWQHRHILKAFLYQNESKKALQYVRTAHPPLTTREDVKLFLTVLLANGLTAEAFHFQRQYRDEANTEELLGHLILGSQQTKTIDQLLKLPFDNEEEAILERYLQESSEPNSQELLIMHYLQRARYVEAIRMNEKLKQQGLMADTDPAARERATARNAIVESYAKLLPPVQRRLAFGPETSTRRATVIRREVSKPKPLSTVINPAKTSKVLSNAMLINAVLDRIAEVRAQVREDEAMYNKSVSDDPDEDLPTMEPFVGTPITPRTKSRFGDLSSVVYPEVMGRDLSPWKRQPSPTKTRPFVQTDSSLRFMEKMTSSRAPIDYTSASALTLLQTPPVRKRTPTKLRNEGTPTVPSIHSILKVRNTSQRIPNEAKEGKAKKSVRAKFEVDFPTPPSVTHKSAFSKPTSEQTAKPTPVPKRITFADDTKPRTPSPVIVKAEPVAVELMFDVTPPLNDSPTPDAEMVSPPLQPRTPSPEQSPLPSDRTPSPQVQPSTPLPQPTTPDEEYQQAVTPTPGDRLSQDASPSLTESPPTENFEMAVGMFVDDEIAFNFDAPHDLEEDVAMELTDQQKESPEKFELRLSSEEDINTGDEVRDELEGEEDEFKDADDKTEEEEEEEEDEEEEEEEEEIESKPLYFSDLIPSPRPPIRPVAPHTATPRSSQRSALGSALSSALSFSSLKYSPLPKKRDEVIAVEETTADDEVAPEEDKEEEMPPLEETAPTPPDDFPQTDEGIQTSPMDLLAGTSHQEMSVQTTPGLALRQEGSMPTRVPFESSLLSVHDGEVMTPPTSGEEMGEESSSEPTTSQDEGVVETDFRPSNQIDVAMETSQQDEEEIVKQESVKPKRGRKSLPTTPALSFIFSPPKTRSRTGTRQHALKIIDEVTTPLTRRPMTSTNNPLPTVGPTPSLDLGTSIGYTPTGPPTGVTTPSTGRGSTRRGRRSHTPKVDTPEAVFSSRPSRRSVTPVVRSEQKVRGYDLSAPLTRSKKSLGTPHQSPTDSPVNLISPLEEGMEGAQTSQQGRPKRVVRMAPHSMTLRTPRERKTRSVKLW